MIKPASAADLGDLLDMAQRFHAVSEMPVRFNRGFMAQNLTQWINFGIVLRSEHGMIAGGIIPAYCDPDWKVAIETLWFSEDGKGLPLLRAFESAARDAGANEIRMTHLSALPRAAKALSRAGYDAVEVSHSKVISWH